MGLTTIVYEGLRPNVSIWAVVYKFKVSYLAISLSLNTFLTLMIVIRLILHTRRIRGSIGINGIGGFCRATVTMLIESSALYAVSSLLVLGPWGVGNGASDIFIPILYEIQVRAFPCPRSPYRLFNAMSDWSGHRSSVHHQPSREQKRVYE